MSGNKTLHDILKTYQEIEMKIIDSDGELNEELESMLDLNSNELSNKLDGYEKFSRYLKGQVEYLKEMENHYNKRRKVLEKSVKKCKDSMLEAMILIGQDKLKTKEFNFSIGKSKKWEFDDSLISDEIKNNLINQGLAENTFKIHLNEVKASYKENGEEVPEWINIIENNFIRVS